jgi:hypothetical protein
MIAIVLPFMLIPEQLFNQHLVLKTDTMACVFGHQNRLMKGDETASIFVRAVHLICAYLGSILHIEHVPRCSDWGSEVADNLSREVTTGFLENRMLTRWQNLPVPSDLKMWLQNPTEDWDLPFKLLKYVQKNKYIIPNPNHRLFDFFGKSHSIFSKRQPLPEITFCLRIHCLRDRKDSTMGFSD